MKLRQAGGCQCGKIGYEITEEPQSVYTCHCLACQRLTRAVFSLGIVVPEKSVSPDRIKMPLYMWKRFAANVVGATVLMVSASAHAGDCLDPRTRKSECDQQRCISLMDRPHTPCEKFRPSVCSAADANPSEKQDNLEYAQKCLDYTITYANCFITPGSELDGRISGMQHDVDECSAAMSK